MSLWPFSGKKKAKNRYSERKSVSLTHEKGRTNRTLRRTVREGRRLGLKSLSGFFCVATALTVCALGFILVAMGFIFTYRWATSSDYFALRNIEVNGINNLSYTEVLKQAEVQTGQNSLDLSLDVLEAKLLSSPWINAVSVKRALPDGLVIAIKEHEPRYWVLHNGRMYYADRNAALIAEVNSNKFLALPVLEIERNSEGLIRELQTSMDKLGGVIANLPPDYQAPALYRLSRAEGMEVQFEGKKLSLLLGLENIDENINHMVMVLNDLKARNELSNAREVRAHDGKVWVVNRDG